MRTPVVPVAPGCPSASSSTHSVSGRITSESSASEMKRDGRQQAQARMAPAHERLESAQAPVGEAHARLEVHHDLAAAASPSRSSESRARRSCEYGSSAAS